MENNSIKFEMALRDALRRRFEDELAEESLNAGFETVYVCSERHNERMRKLFALDKRRDVFKWCAASAKKAAVIVMFVTTLAPIALASSDKVSAAVYDTIVEWFSRSTKYWSSSTYEITDGVASSYWHPAYLPAGFTQTASSVGADISSATYGNSAGETISLIYTRSSNTAEVNNENAVYKKRTVKGVTYDLYAANEANINNMVIWETSGYRFQLISQVNMSNLLKIACSFVQC